MKLLSLFCDSGHRLQVVTALERDSENSNSFIKNGIILGEVYLNNFELVNIEYYRDVYNISLIYNDERDYLLYDSIKKHHPIVRIYELNQISSAKYDIIDTLLIANLEDTLRFSYNQTRKNSFVICNDGFMPKNYRIEKKK